MSARAAYVAEQLEKASVAMGEAVELLTASTPEHARAQAAMFHGLFFAIARERGAAAAIARLEDTYAALCAKLTAAGLEHAGADTLKHVQALIDLHAAGGPYTSAAEAAEGIDQVLATLARPNVLPFRRPKRA